MKCYYHSDKDSVAQCRLCKKFICKPCYDNFHDGICPECSKEDDLANAEYIRASRERSIKGFQKKYKSYKRDIVIAGCIGIVLSIILLSNIQVKEVHSVLFNIFIILLATYLSIAVYSGYMLFKWEMPDLPEVGVFMYLKFAIGLLFQIIKLPIAIILGIFGAIPLYLKKRQKYLQTLDE